mmetsp:Transcript_65620/g.184786  ORF Transcript_65620/g.184786 Transcript_65620/m.184786 type:complete len:259 (-) Transcript_65620:96-872(-)
MVFGMHFASQGSFDPGMFACGVAPAPFGSSWNVPPSCGDQRMNLVKFMTYEAEEGQQPGMSHLEQCGEAWHFPEDQSSGGAISDSGMSNEEAWRSFEEEETRLHMCPELEHMVHLRAPAPATTWCASEMEETNVYSDEEQQQSDEEQQHEDERLARDRLRKTMVEAFLREHGYTGVDVPKRTILKLKYPIHTAAKYGNAQLVEMLIEEGADPLQKDSAGQTAAQVAQMKDTRGSHSGVLSKLEGTLTVTITSNSCLNY